MLILVTVVLLDGIGLPLALAASFGASAPRDLAARWLSIHVAAGLLVLWFKVGRPTPTRKPVDSSSYGSHGTARFTRSEELRSYLKTKGPGLILGKDRRGYLILPPDPKLACNRNVTVIGGSGVRKTRSFVQPNILQAAQHGGESLLVIDPKGENYARSAFLLRESGYPVHVLNLLQPDRSDRWNPLDAVDSVPLAADLASNLVSNTVNPNRPRTGDPFWDNAEQAFITALVLYIKFHRPPAEQHMASVLELGTELSPHGLDHLFLARPRTDPARRFYRSFLRAEDKIRAGVVAGLGSRLQLWNSPEIARLTATSDLRIAEFASGPKALFLIIPDSKSTYAPLLALFWQQVFELLYRVADAKGGRLPIPVRCVMDEIANCGYIPDYEKKKSTMRARGISTEEVWQSLGQIKARYPATWSELLANADHLLFLGSNDLETAEYISKKLGQTTIRLESMSSSQSDKSVSTGQSAVYGGRPLLTVDEVLRLPGDQALLIPRGAFPARVEKADFTTHPLADRIELWDHNHHQPAAGDDLLITDVRALWQAVQRRQPPDEPAQPEAQGDSDTTGFIDHDVDAKKGGPD